MHVPNDQQRFLKEEKITDRVSRRRVESPRPGMRGLGRILVLVPMILSLAACLQRPLASKPIVLGALYNLTGSQSVLDGPSLQGARLAVMEANARGGVLGRPVQLEIVDGRSDTGVILAKTRALLRKYPDLTGLVGFSDTDMVLAAAPAVEEGQLPFITSGATSPLLPREFPRYLYLACFGDNVQASAGAQWAYEYLQARRAIVLYNDTMAYTRLLHGYFQRRFVSLGGTIVDVRAYRPMAFADALRNLPPADLIFLSASPEDAVTVLPGIRAAGIDLPILGGDGLDIGADWRKNDAITDVYFTTHVYLGADSANPVVTLFRRNYLDHFPGSEPDAFSALGYDAMGLLLEAVGKAGSDDPRSVRLALMNINGFRGVTGVIGYGGTDRIPRKSVTVMTVARGKEAFVAEVLPAEIPPP